MKHDMLRRLHAELTAANPGRRFELCLFSGDGGWIEEVMAGGGRKLLYSTALSCDAIVKCF